MNRQDLVKVLELLKPALAKDNTIPAFQCFCLNEGRISAYNDAIAIVGPLDVEHSIGLHGGTLLGLLSNSNAEAVDISLEKDTALLKMGKTISRLPFIGLDDFIFTTPESDWDFKLPLTESTCNFIKIALETVSSDETQLALHGVTVEGDKLYSCDGDSVTRMTLKSGVGKNRILMPTAFCEAVVKLWATLAVTKGTLYFNGEWAFADFGEWAVYGRILEIADPINFAELITTHVKKTDQCFDVPKGLVEALSRARVLSDPESQKTTVTVEKGKLTLYTQTHMGEIKDSLDFKGHPDIKSNVNASHLQRALQVCPAISFLETCTLFQLDSATLIVSNMA